MKDRLFLTITLICALALSLFPATPISAAESEVWVLADTQFEPPEMYLDWQMQFMDTKTFYTITISESEFTYRYRINGDMGTTADVFFEYTFDTPPEELIPGESISLVFTGSVTGTAYTLNKMRLTLSLQEWAKDNALISTVSGTELTLDELGEQDSQILQFVVPEISDGKLVIKTGNNIAAQAQILWVYEPGESQSKSIGETIKTEHTVISQEDWEKMREDVASQTSYTAYPWIAEKFRDGYIGMIVAATGDYTLTDYSGRSMRVGRGQLIRIGDTIQTGEDGRLRIQMFDRDEEGNTGPSTVNVATNSEARITKFLASFNAHPDIKVRQERETFISLIKEWGQGLTEWVGSELKGQFQDRGYYLRHQGL